MSKFIPKKEKNPPESLTTSLQKEILNHIKSKHPKTKDPAILIGPSKEAIRKSIQQSVIREKIKGFTLALPASKDTVRVKNDKNGKPTIILPLNLLKESSSDIKNNIMIHEQMVENYETSRLEEIRLKKVRLIKRKINSL